MSSFIKQLLNNSMHKDPIITKTLNKTTVKLWHGIYTNELLCTKNYMKVQTPYFLEDKDRTHKNYFLLLSGNMCKNKSSGSFPNAENVFVSANDKNHLYYTLCRFTKDFPKLKNLFIGSHPCEPTAGYLYYGNVFIKYEYGARYFGMMKNQSKLNHSTTEDQALMTCLEYKDLFKKFETICLQNKTD